MCNIGLFRYYPRLAQEDLHATPVAQAVTGAAAGQAGTA